MILEAKLYRGVVQKREERDGITYWARILHGNEQINERGPFAKREDAHAYVRDQIQRVKMADGIVCA